MERVSTKPPVAADGHTLGELRRLGKNHNGYDGERIDIAAVLEDCMRAAKSHGWDCGLIAAEPGLMLHTYSRRACLPSGGSRQTAYVSAGIHGDEPAGPLAMRQLLAEDAWPTDIDLWVCPCLNPTGFVANSRENASGTDLNRQYLQPQAPEVIAHIAWLEQQPFFNLCICLHEDWESHGFYLYELNPDHQPTAAEAMIQQVRLICPIDASGVIDGRAARGGIIRPEPDFLTRKQWPEAFFLLMHKTRHSYTLEAPSDFPLAVRVAALVAAVNMAFRGGTGNGERSRLDKVSG